MAEERFLGELSVFLPAGLDRLHPTRDSSESTEVVLSACMRFTGHKTFLAFDGGYHGSTLAVSISTAEQAID